MNIVNLHLTYANRCTFYVVSIHREQTKYLLYIRYPHSVNEGYIQYQFYDSLQGLCSYLRGVVSTTAVLTAAGVGDAEATALSAAMVRE